MFYNILFVKFLILAIRILKNKYFLFCNKITLFWIFNLFLIFILYVHIESDIQVKNINFLKIWNIEYLDGHCSNRNRIIYYSDETNWITNTSKNRNIQYVSPLIWNVWLVFGYSFFPRIYLNHFFRKWWHLSRCLN